jgi:phosphonate metabolism protein PhnN/1,5-bisphosphokinase (PRPP-forming)
VAGIFFAVVGASGVGKDAILSTVKPKLEAAGNYHFPTRLITRPADAGGEHHQNISSSDFVQAVREDRFSLWWMAHEMHYALPDTVFEKLRFGTHVIANISRRSVGEAIRKFNRVEVIEITAKPEMIKNRLVMRGRESEAEIMVRQLREVEPNWSGSALITTIENNDSLADAADQFIVAVLNRSSQNAERAQTA